MKYPELTGICKECKYKCGRVENPLFTGVKECEYCTLQQITIEQMKMEGIWKVK